MSRPILIALILMSLPGPSRAADSSRAEAGRLEFFGSGGFARTTTFMAPQLGGALAAQAGIGVDLSASLTAELSLGYDALGSAQVAFLPPGQDFGSDRVGFSLVPITAGIVFRIPSESRVRPFLGAAAGAYLFHAAPDTAAALSSTTTRPGFNLGGGLLFPTGGMDVRLEARFHHRLGQGAEAAMDLVTVAAGIQYR